MNRKVFSVTQINRYIKSVLEDDLILQDVFIEGELSNFKHHNSGHMYFTLKDGGGALQCVMFRSYAGTLPFLPKDGMKVICRGHVSLYDKTGQFQLYAETMEPVGKGGLYAAFEQLRDKLSAEGLFDASHKRPIPIYPKCIAVVTSPSGAAVRDIIQIVRRRNKAVPLVIAPVLVQGENAAADIARAIRDVNVWGKADLMIVGRGGGSIEDLWAFNEEIVARAIYHSKIPVISAVGHETDYTIADFAADLRAPTPSAAAEIAAPSLEDAEYRLRQASTRLLSSMEYKLSVSRNRYLSVINRRLFRYPLENVYSNQVYLDNLIKKLNGEMNHRLEKCRMTLTARLATLESASPLATLQRGYSIIYKERRIRVRSVRELCDGDAITIRFYDGEVKARILDGGE